MSRVSGGMVQVREGIEHRQLRRDHLQGGAGGPVPFARFDVATHLQIPRVPPDELARLRRVPECGVVLRDAVVLEETEDHVPLVDHELPPIRRFSVTPGASVPPSAGRIPHLVHQELDPATGDLEVARLSA